VRYERLYFPRKDPRYLRRNALVAAGNTRDPELREAVEAHARNGDPLLRDHAEWALHRLEQKP
jgi:epoxyqueuosine reductase